MSDNNTTDSETPATSSHHQAEDQQEQQQQQQVTPPKPTRPLPQPRALSLNVNSSNNQDDSASNLFKPLDDSFEAVASRIKGLKDPQDPNKLTPLRAHYLKKHLVALQLNQEIHALSGNDALSTFGPPFSPSPNTTRADLPLLRFLFHHFVLTFPFLRSAPPNFFSAKVQVFFNRFLSRNISSTDDRTETTKRTKAAGKIEKYAALLLSSSISVSGLSGKNEQVVKISDSDRERITILENKLKKVINGESIHEEFDVNVIGVRTVTSKGRLRNRSHEEFIIRTKRSGMEDVFVSRRYGDFIRLADTLRIEFPDEEIRPPPTKDRSGIEIGQERRREARMGATEEETETLKDGMGNLSVDDPDNNRPPSAPPSHSRARVRTLSNAASKLRGGHSTPSSPSKSNANLPPVPPLPGASSSSAAVPLPTGPLAREKNRLTLRAYIRSLLSLPQVSESAALADFLLGEPVILSNSEMEDARVREGLDELRASEATRFEDEASKKVRELKVHLDEFKEELIQPDGLTKIFSLIRSTSNLYDLPPRYLALLSWARISLASTLFSLFMASDTSSELFAQLKRIHGIMPYFMLRQILRISNPVSMIRGVLDLFLAQPFGGRSLAQRMVSGGLMDDVKNLAEICNAVSRKVEDVDMCERIRCFVYSSKEIQDEFRKQAKDEGLDLITVILRAPIQEFEFVEGSKSNSNPDPNKIQPPPNPFLENLKPLNRSQIQRAVKASRAFERYKLYRKEPGELSGKDDKNDEEEDEFDLDGWGPKEEDEDAWLYEDLHVLLRMCTRLRDKEQLIELVFEGVTSELLKDMVTIFYSPLAQVYKAANIADSLYDLQKFIDDLIKTVEGCEEVAYSDPQAIVQVFIDLVARHESKFYNFVHQVHSKGSGLFDGLMQWIELFINFVRGSTASNLDADSTSTASPEDQHPAFSSEQGQQKTKKRGIGSVDLEVCLPAGGTQRTEALSEIDALVVHAYRLKFQREIKLRKRIVRREIEGAGRKAESSMTRQIGGKSSESWNQDDDAQFVRAAVENLGVGDVFSREVEEADQDSSQEEEEDDEDEDEDEDEGDEEQDDEGTEDPNQEPGMAAKSRSSSGKLSTAHRRLASGEDEDASWRPPPIPLKDDKDLPPVSNPKRSDSTFVNAGTTSNKTPEEERNDRIDRERKRKGKAPAPRLPPLRHIPEMLPLFVEMLRPLLRPARTASGSTTTTLADATSTAQAQPPPPPQKSGGWW